MAVQKKKVPMRRGLVRSENRAAPYTGLPGAHPCRRHGCGAAAPQGSGPRGRNVRPPPGVDAKVPRKARPEP